MSSVAEIEQAIEQLSPQDFRALSEWIANRDAAAWDDQFERDVSAGKLDALADEALAELRAGRCAPL